MEPRKFIIEAAEFFLCIENGGLTVEEQLELLEDICKEEKQVHPPSQIIVWEPFEYWMADRILEEIYNLSGLLERIYKLGYDRKGI